MIHKSLKHGRAILLVAVGICTMVACENPDRYKLEKDERGRTIRLDQETGEIAVIDGDTIRVIQSEEETERERKVERILLETPNKFSETDLVYFGKDIKANVSTIWRDGNLHYKFQMHPASDKILKARETYTHAGGIFLSFYDVNDFEVVKIKVPTSELVGTHDVGNKIVGFSANGATPVSSEDYQSITSWNIGWYGY